MVYLHEFVTAVQTGYGLKPRPASPGAAELSCPPVRVALYRPGESQPFAVVEAAGFALHPHRPAVVVDGAVVRPAAVGSAVVACVVPDAGEGVTR